MQISLQGFRAFSTLLLILQGVLSFRVGHKPGTPSDGFDSPAEGFAASEAAANDFVAHFVSKENLGIIFSAELRVTGFYRDEATGHILPGEESGMVRIGDQIVSINGAEISSLPDLKAAMAAAEVPVRIKFRPPPGKDDDRQQKTCSDFRFNITIYSAFMPQIDLTTDEFIVVDAEIDALLPGDKLVAVAGEEVKGLSFSIVQRKISKMFEQEVLRCQKTHCQVEKVADYIAAKILTFEPQLPSYRQSYTVFDVDPEGCEEGDLECISRKADSAHLRRGIPTADNSMSVSISSKKEHPRVLLQSVGNLQEATLQLFLRDNATSLPEIVGEGRVTGTSYSSMFPCGEFLVRRARPVYACSPLQAAQENNFVLVRSGSCSAYDKAMNVQYARGRGILLMDESLTKKNARDLSTHPLNVATMRLDRTLTQLFLDISDDIVEGNYTAKLKTPRCGDN